MNEKKDKKKVKKTHEKYNKYCDFCTGCLDINPRCDYCGIRIDKWCEYDSKNKLVSCCPEIIDENGETVNDKNGCMKKLIKIYKNTNFDPNNCNCDKVWDVPGECRCHKIYY